MKASFLFVVSLAALAAARPGPAERPRIREMGLRIGVYEPGPLNAITDIAGVLVGHVTLVEGPNVRTGVTAILPHGGNIFQDKVPAAVFVGNGFGKLTGSTQVQELGLLETPIVLTNTLSVPTAADALIDYTLGLAGNEEVQSVNPVVGETNDGWLNDIRGRHVTKAHVLEAIRKASGGPVEEGSVGAGTGTSCFHFKGGIGTASRRLPADKGGWAVGVIVQTNHGGVLRVDGVPAGLFARSAPAPAAAAGKPDGSCLIVVATDAPLDSRNLRRLAARALLGIARTGGINSNASGDYAIAFSTAEGVRVPHRMTDALLAPAAYLRNDALSPLFQAAAESAEEAILDSMSKSGRMVGRDGHILEALPLDKLGEFLKAPGK